MKVNTENQIYNEYISQRIKKVHNNIYGGEDSRAL